MSEQLSDIEYDILNAIYFVEPFQNILDECKAPEKIVADVLKQLIAKKYVSPMQFNEDTQEYVRTYFYDSDDMRAYHYLATKEGLMIHNSR
ncbi:MAG: hypothetical protein V4590_00565 [Bacteroidota bacterium]